MIHSHCRTTISTLTGELHIAREQVEQWRGLFLRERETTERLMQLALNMKRDGFVPEPDHQAALQATIAVPTPQPEPEPQPWMSDELEKAIAARTFDDQTGRELARWAEGMVRNGMHPNRVAEIILDGAVRDDAGEAYDEVEEAAA